MRNLIPFGGLLPANRLMVPSPPGHNRTPLLSFIKPAFAFWQSLKSSAIASNTGGYQISDVQNVEAACQELVWPCRSTL